MITHVVKALADYSYMYIKSLNLLCARIPKIVKFNLILSQQFQVYNKKFNPCPRLLNTINYYITFSVLL